MAFCLALEYLKDLEEAYSELNQFGRLVDYDEEREFTRKNHIIIGKVVNKLPVYRHSDKRIQDGDCLVMEMKKAYPKECLSQQGKTFRLICRGDAILKVNHVEVNCFLAFKNPKVFRTYNSTEPSFMIGPGELVLWELPYLNDPYEKTKSSQENLPMEGAKTMSNGLNGEKSNERITEGSVENDNEESDSDYFSFMRKKRSKRFKHGKTKFSCASTPVGSNELLNDGLKRPLEKNRLLTSSVGLKKPEGDQHIPSNSGSTHLANLPAIRRQTSELSCNTCISVNKVLPNKAFDNQVCHIPENRLTNFYSGMRESDCRMHHSSIVHRCENLNNYFSPFIQSNPCFNRTYCNCNNNPYNMNRCACTWRPSYDCHCSVSNFNSKTSRICEHQSGKHGYYSNIPCRTHDNIGCHEQRSDSLNTSRLIDTQTSVMNWINSNERCPSPGPSAISTIHLNDSCEEEIPLEKIKENGNINRAFPQNIGKDKDKKLPKNPDIGFKKVNKNTHESNRSILTSARQATNKKKKKLFYIDPNSSDVLLPTDPKINVSRKRIVRPKTDETRKYISSSSESVETSWDEDQEQLIAKQNVTNEISNNKKTIDLTVNKSNEVVAETDTEVVPAEITPLIEEENISPPNKNTCSNESDIGIISESEKNDETVISRDVSPSELCILSVASLSKEDKLATSAPENGNPLELDGLLKTKDSEVNDDSCGMCAQNLQREKLTNKNKSENSKEVSKKMNLKENGLDYRGIADRLLERVKEKKNATVSMKESVGHSVDYSSHDLSSATLRINCTNETEDNNGQSQATEKSSSQTYYDANEMEEDIPSQNIEIREEFKALSERSSKSLTELFSSETQARRDLIFSKLGRKDHIFNINAVLIDIFPELDYENPMAIVKCFCYSGCKQSFPFADVSFPEAKKKLKCKHCPLASHHICPFCKKSGKTNFLCMKFSFDMVVLYGTTVIRIQAYGKNAESFLGCTVREYKTLRNAAEIVRLMSKIRVKNPPEDWSEVPLLKLKLKTVPYSDGSVVPQVVNTRLENCVMKKKRFVSYKEL